MNLEEIINSKRDQAKKVMKTAPIYPNIATGSPSNVYAPFNQNTFIK